MKILILGSQGMVGSALSREFTSQGYEVFNHTRKILDLENCSIPEMESLLNSFLPDIIILAAARVGGILVNSAENSDFFAINNRIQSNVLTAVENYQQKTDAFFIFLGSSCMYPPSIAYLTEKDNQSNAPREVTNSGYSWAKTLAGRRIESGVFRSIVVVPCNLFGPGDTYDLYESHVVPAQILKHYLYNNIVIGGKGDVLREFMYVEDLAIYCRYISEYYGSLPKILNCSPREEYSILDMIKIIGEEFVKRNRKTYRYSHDYSMPEGVQRKRMDTSIQDKLFPQFKPRSLREGISLTIDAFLSDKESL